MAVFIMPTSSGVNVSPFYEVAVELDGVEFRFVFKFNGRNNTWFFNILDSNGVLLRAGIPVVSSTPLLFRFSDITRPAGELVALSVALNDIDPAGLEQLGRDVLLTYNGAA